MTGELPHNMEIEQGVLGALLCQNKHFELFSTAVKPDDFYDPVHGEIFELAAKLIASSQVASPVTLAPYFENAEPLSDNLSVVQYLGRLAAAAALSTSLPSYVTALVELARRRELVALGRDLQAKAACPDISPTRAIEETENACFEMRSRSTRRGAEMDLGQALDEALIHANEAYQNKGGLCGLSTGLRDLDCILGGLGDSDLIILAGRPSMGKTALATNIAYKVARKENFIHFFSQEMSAQQLAMRLIAEKTEISSANIRRGAFEERDFRRMGEAANLLRKLPWHIDETGGITMSQLAMRARRLRDKRHTKLILVDYLQLMTPARASGNRVQDITEITTGLKALAKELHLPIIALSQLSRKVEDRADKRPQLSDLRESGSIEQDADVVLFVYRDEYYTERLRPDENDPAAFADWEEAMRRCAGTAEVIIGKQRHGPCGTVKLSFDAKHTRFCDGAFDQRSAAA